MTLGKRFPNLLDWIKELRDAIKTTWKTAEKIGITKSELINTLVFLKFYELDGTKRTIK
jgi:hypothetical protein